MNEKIDVLKNILYRMGVSGIRIEMVNDTQGGIYLIYNDILDKYMLFGLFSKIEYFFNNFCISDLIELLKKYKKGELSLRYYKYRYDKINDAGLMFLETIYRCSSWEEFLLKIQMNGCCV